MRERTSTILTAVFLTGAIALADWKTPDAATITEPTNGPGLLETVTVRQEGYTNVVQGDNHSGCPHRNHSIPVAPGVFSTTLLYHPYHEGCSDYVAPTKRWTITEIGIRRVLTATGFPGELVAKTVISCTTNTEVLASQWVPADKGEELRPKTNLSVTLPGGSLDLFLIR